MYEVWQELSENFGGDGPVQKRGDKYKAQQMISSTPPFVLHIRVVIKICGFTLFLK